MRTQSALALDATAPASGRPIAVSPTRAARLIGIGRTKLYEALTSGELSSYRIGRRRLIRVVDLEAWLGAHAVKPADGDALPANAKAPARRSRYSP
ncbi:MAG: helix-turn-helix domain-containing protein [Hyphomonadaceae bacterium]|nr:helix-turn-helix domain-containing protein [Hyphomonadaceae bacterium]